MNEPKHFFTSDLHLDHKNITGPKISNWTACYRNFETKNEMNKVLLDNLNSTVGEDDILYFLGDFCFGGHVETPKWRKKINCKTIHFIKGNHDEKIHLYEECFTSIRDTRITNIEKQMIFMSHYPHRVWPDSHHGSFCLYGHTHAALEDFPWGKSMDVGVDAAYRFLGEYRPFSFEEIKEILDKRAKYGR
jgi:calcineurin-like phosphoesterase family protein